jgi:hypothetical protein
MLSVIRETQDADPEVSQIRVHPDGQYDVINVGPDGDETGDGKEPGTSSSKKRKQPSASPVPGAAAAAAPATSTGAPAAQRPALGQGAAPTRANEDHVSGTSLAALVADVPHLCLCAHVSSLCVDVSRCSRLNLLLPLLQPNRLLRLPAQLVPLLSAVARLMSPLS